HDKPIPLMLVYMPLSLIAGYASVGYGIVILFEWQLLLMIEVSPINLECLNQIAAFVAIHVKFSNTNADYMGGRIEGICVLKRHVYKLPAPTVILCLKITKP
ncbi:uncharacterized protein METZ01_LOCUS512553, partial [marine metagenome]